MITKVPNGNSLDRDTKVLLPKGSVVTTTSSRREYTLQRAQAVAVWNVNKPYTYEGVYHPEEIVWAGSGGYWCRSAGDQNGWAIITEG